MQCDTMTSEMSAKKKLEEMKRAITNRAKEVKCKERENRWWRCCSNTRNCAGSWVKGWDIVPWRCWCDTIDTTTGLWQEVVSLSGVYMEYMKTLLEIYCQCINFHLGQDLYYIRKPHRNWINEYLFFIFNVTPIILIPLILYLGHLSLDNSLSVKK